MVLLSLYFGNPTTEAFAYRLVNHMDARLVSDLGLPGSLVEMDRYALQHTIEEHTRRDNYFFASVFTLPPSDGEMRVLGISAQFVWLSGPSRQSAATNGTAAA